MGTRTMRRFRFNQRRDELKKDQAEEIDFSSGEWVIEFTPEEAHPRKHDEGTTQDIDLNR